MMALAEPVEVRQAGNTSGAEVAESVRYRPLTFRDSRETRGAFLGATINFNLFKQLLINYLDHRFVRHHLHHFKIQQHPVVVVSS
jgi:hypothetical protein